MNKGFTLIELLAVIVILAVIALIATPIILNIVEDSKKSAATESAQLYADGLVKKIVSENMVNEFNPDTCLLYDGVLECDGEIFDYEISGQAPASGTLNFTNGVLSSYILCVSGYRIEKSGNNVTTTKDATCTAEPVYSTPGLYRNGVMAYTWQELIDEGLIVVYQDNSLDGETYYDYVYATAPLNGYLYIDDSIEVINFYAFGNEDIGAGLTGVTIPNSVKLIGYSAFANNQIRSINIPASVTGIYTDSFFNNPLTSITVDPENPVYDSRDNCNAIIYTESNELVQGSRNTVIPNTVTAIDDYAFIGVGLTSITIPSTVEDIGGAAFRNNPLTSITVDPNNQYYDSRDNCNAIINTNNDTIIQGSRNTVIPNTVISIGSYAFDGVGLTSITIPSTVENIGVAAFRNNLLTEFTIPSGIEIIQEDTFANNPLASITVPSSVTQLWPGSFANNQLTSATFGKTNSWYFTGCGDFNHTNLDEIMSNPQAIAALMRENDTCGLATGK